MVTTFVSRKTARADLAALFVTNGSWQAVYGYEPDGDEVDGQSPVLTVRSGGTRQQMMGAFNNPTSYLFIMRTSVRVNQDAGDWDEADAEDALDDLDKELRQVIRNNAGGTTGRDWLEFDETESRTGYSLIGGKLYRYEERRIWAHYAAGG